MKLWLPLLALGVLAGGFAHCAAAGHEPRDGTVPPTASAIVAPLVDHHQHLLSSATADQVAPPPLKAISLPTGLARLLAAREQYWNDKSGLTKLYRPDSIVLSTQSPGWLRGRDAIADYLSSRFSRPYRFTPVEYSTKGSHGHIVGYLTRGDDASPQHFGNFYLSLARDKAGSWRILAEIPSFPGPIRDLAPRSGSELVAALDSAGVQRAVVLSDAFFYPSRSLPSAFGETATRRQADVRAENEWVLQQVRPFLDRLIPFCSFSPLEDYALAELEYCAARGFKGLKLHLDESRVDLKNRGHVAKVREVFAAANRLRLPIVVHVGNNQGSSSDNRHNVETLINEIAAAAPEIIVQIAHLWGGQEYSPSALAAYSDAVSSSNPATKNLYFDVAEVARMILLIRDEAEADAARETIATHIRRIGLGRILFGSDDHLPPKDAWAAFQKEVPLTKEELNTIAGNVAPYAR